MRTLEHEKELARQIISLLKDDDIEGIDKLIVNNKKIEQIKKEKKQ